MKELDAPLYDLLWRCTMEDKAAMDANLLRVETRAAELEADNRALEKMLAFTQSKLVATAKERAELEEAYQTAAKVIEESLPDIAFHLSGAVDKQKAAEARVELVAAAYREQRGLREVAEMRIPELLLRVAELEDELAQINLICRTELAKRATRAAPAPKDGSA